MLLKNCCEDFAVSTRLRKSETIPIHVPGRLFRVVEWQQIVKEFTSLFRGLDISLVNLSIAAILRDAFGGSEVFCNITSSWAEYVSLPEFLDSDGDVQIWHGLLYLNRFLHLALVGSCCVTMRDLMGNSDRN